MENAIKTAKGTPLPIGTTRTTDGINFAILAKDANSIALRFQTDGIHTDLPLDPLIHKTGDIWHIFVYIEDKMLIHYGYLLNGNTKLVLDPYAKALNTPGKWGSILPYEPIGVVAPFTEKFPFSPFQPSPVDEWIIYEMHVRGFTKDASSITSTPGTFKALIEKIPHLLDLGITAVELMPIFEFNEQEYKLFHPKVQQNLYQYWGYSTVNFFSPMNKYATSDKPTAAALEFKEMVEALHQNGIAVILDVVYNHTAENDEKGPAFSFKCLDLSTYYILTPDGKLANYTGCGNTISSNHPHVQNFILDSLRYWVLEMGVDGFRFDLASIFYRDINGNPIPNPPILDAISHDPILAGKVLIAEPWDAALLYNVGNFYPKENRWSEWNGKYRDEVRGFIKGTGSKKQMATRLCGSEDLYHTRSPLASVNFITAHDGFTLQDLVSYNDKHNQNNGEGNRDGESHNNSWNCGAEGATNDKNILALRERQKRNFLVALFVSQGLPMLLMGDEYGHTREGNNNSWCQDNSLNWFQWDLLDKNKDFYRFCKKMIEFRKKHPIFHLGRFLNPNDIQWIGPDGQNMNWDNEDGFLAFILKDPKTSYLVAFNAKNSPQNLSLPKNTPWKLLVNTANPSPYDFIEQPTLLNKENFKIEAFSSIILTI